MILIHHWLIYQVFHGIDLNQISSEQEKENLGDDMRTTLKNKMEIEKQKLLYISLTVYFGDLRASLITIYSSLDLPTMAIPICGPTP
ncbi:hypothetical protein F8388_000104 [Cannabis sativa]|uniref:Uncharacterized protein n=1 Tax=Cannabis sativa TaxID=3483 RepID=A0A7J6FMT0_CANSA|nr:hypothetical protein F8388_000104 [Cannabis sativa]